MGIVVTVASQKGGVGKTTTVVNLAASLALAGRRVLLFDFDPQGNASSGVGLAEAFGAGKPPKPDAGYLSAALAGKSVAGFLRRSGFDNLTVVVSFPDLSELPLIHECQGRGLEKFRKQVRETAQDFDVVIFDCPPSLGGLPTIALSVSHRAVIPIQCEYYAMEGLSQILPVINKINKTTNIDLQIGGLLLTMFSEDLQLCQDVVSEVREYFGGAVFRTVVPRDVVLAEAASHGLPAFHYGPESRGAWSYIELAKEVLEHDWTKAR